MVNVEIAGIGTSLPQNYVDFAGGRRFRISGEETHLKLLCASAINALKNANMTIDDIDAVVGAVTIGLQPIPCTAALVHEVIAKDKSMPAFDVNSTCTSFITALDLVSLQIQSGRFKRVLIVSGDVASLALNENERHSFELFGDGAVSMVIAKSENADIGILYAHQITLSSGAHLTEIAGGGSNFPPYHYNEKIKSKFQFHMEGKSALVLAFKIGVDLFADTLKSAGLSLDDIDMVIPHQASPALDVIMKKLGIPSHKYINIIKEYGNMVSGSVPFAFKWAVDNGKIKRGDTVLFMGTAAGLTANSLLLRY
ncbi:MAG: hypothetical protein LBQ18_06270 [Campylobacteraceae bacterium]|jgi:3-oxoacyl-[acyl-carrier-protein] synthase-3|nr:hypothetical protein [Campylobacteraceae bacterium]